MMRTIRTTDLTTMPVLLPCRVNRVCASESSFEQKRVQISSMRVDVLVDVEPREPNMTVRASDGLKCQLPPSGYSGHILSIEPHVGGFRPSIVHANVIHGECQST